ncbi:SNF2-related protein [Halomonas cerina]|uniref:SNF2 family DNA or RNA helicase n=1 Tax=Halomonas cerina TaxID=447424 RepID=A0A839V704_9GAMM|nr:SNF2-related protein [Halomonas cerina]MBB3189740.1 SNF2 family DNA or RNA helicase [Halomonas cerina]
MTTQQQEALSQAGTKVRMKYDPSQIGECTGKADDDDGDFLVQVSFNGKRPDWFIADQLELLEEEVEDDITRIRTGRIDTIDTLKRAFARIQLGGKMSEIFYSMDTTHTEFMPHQFKPVLAMLDSPSQGLLIADEVGLGKTIEAGLIWTELRFRKQARRLLVVCPAMLTEKWQYELRYRFGTAGTITDAAGLLEILEHPDQLTVDNQCIICSLQGIRPPSEWEKAETSSPAARLARRLNEMSVEDPVFDMTIIDEAHYLRNPETASATLGNLLRRVSDHIALLTATPVNTSNRDLHSLVRLADPDQFQFADQFQSILEANRPLVKASNALKLQASTYGNVLEHLTDAQQHWVLRRSEQLQELIEELEGYDLSTTPNSSQRIRLRERIERLNLLSHIITRTRKREVMVNRATREAKHLEVPMSPEEQSAYDIATEAIARYAEENDSPEGFLLAMPQRQMSSCIFAAVDHWLNTSGLVEGDNGQFYEDTGEDGRVLPESSSRLIGHIGRHIAGKVDLSALRINDSKYAQLIEALSAFLKRHSDEKVIVFSYFKKTLSYLNSRLKEDGIRSVIVQGGQDKKAIIDEFRNSRTQQVLLSSEVASEGVDLQFMRFIINYDLPWNPMKVEQRIGRIDRIGQKSPKINIFSFVYKDTIDDKILNRLFDRLNLFENALGGAEDILGDSISVMSKRLLSGKLTPAQQQAQIEQTADAIEQRRRDEEIVDESSSSLVALGDYIQSQVTEAHSSNRKISDEDLIEYITDFLDRYAPGHTINNSERDHQFSIRLPANIAIDFGDFTRKEKLTPSRLSTGHEKSFIINNQVASGSTQKYELVNQFHPFIKYICQKISQEEPHTPLLALKADASNIPVLKGGGIYAFKIENWSFLGSKEEDFVRSAFVNCNTLDEVSGNEASEIMGCIRTHAEDWLEAPTQLDCDDKIRHSIDTVEKLLAREYRKELKEKQSENNDRVRIQEDSVRKSHQRKRSQLEQAISNNMGNDRYIKMTRGRLKSLKNQTEMLMEKINNKKHIKDCKEPVAVGILKVE